MARGAQSVSLSDEDKRIIAEAVVDGLAKSNRNNDHEQLRSMFRLESELARVKEELARSQAEVTSLQAYANQLLAVMRPSAAPTYPTGIPGIPPITYQVPNYPGSSVTAPVAPPVTTTITVPVPTYSEYQYQNSGGSLLHESLDVPRQNNGHTSGE